MEGEVNLFLDGGNIYISNTIGVEMEVIKEEDKIKR